jgi:hypothetical protein
MELNFIDLGLTNILFLFVVGFVGGLVSGFIGSGGAFVLTPAMMNMGVPAIMAVASNMCHKFPKALVGATKRAKYGQVDVKLGIVMGISAEVGVLIGAHLQEHITKTFGKTGSNLYVSTVFVVVLAIVGSYVLRDAWKMYYSSNPDKEEVGPLARWIQSVRIPGTMMYFKGIGTEISVLFTIPLGFATGMLAATIAVGGFIGVPAMIYLLGVPRLMASATELVIAFVMGLGGTIKYAWGGFVDIRLAMIILAGSLFGIQLGAIGTTYVKPYLVKVVMGVLMVLVLFSRGVVIPVYLSELNTWISLDSATASWLKDSSFVMLLLALGVGATIVLHGLWSGYRTHLREQALVTATVGEETRVELVSERLSPMGRFERLLLVSDGSEFSSGAVREGVNLAQVCKSHLYALSVVGNEIEHEALAVPILERERQQALVHLQQVKTSAGQAGVPCDTVLRSGVSVYEEILAEVENRGIDLIVMGRRGRSGLVQWLLGSTTAKMLGQAHTSLLIVPKAAPLIGKRLLVAIDGSRYGDAAATTAGHLMKCWQASLTVLAVVTEDSSKQRVEMAEVVNQTVKLLHREGVATDTQVIRGDNPAATIAATAKAKGVDLIIIGTHGRTGLEKWLLGSVAERVIHLSEGAVLVVKF